MWFIKPTITCETCGHVVDKKRAVKRRAETFVGSYENRDWAWVDIWFCEDDAPAWDARDGEGLHRRYYRHYVPVSKDGVLLVTDDQLISIATLHTERARRSAEADV